MIICDTTAVNTRKIDGIVVQFQKEMEAHGFARPQFLGCQHHILDLILKKVLDNFVSCRSATPCFDYKFVNDITENYEFLQKEYKYEAEFNHSQNLGWRDDFNFLFELCEAVQYYKNSGKLPKIKWRKLPPLHSARWNSRASYAIIAYFLLPKIRQELETAVLFISYPWQNLWFRKQTRFHTDSYDHMLGALTEIKYSAALKCFMTHWNKEDSVICIPKYD